jgi:hypothetical protein
MDTEESNFNHNGGHGQSWLYKLLDFVFQYSHSNGPGSLDKNNRGVKESMDSLSAIASFAGNVALTL